MEEGEETNKNVKIEISSDEEDCVAVDDLKVSQVNEYKELSYKLFQFRTYILRSSNGGFGCPFCDYKEEHENRYIHLLLHAIRVGEEGSGSRKQISNHFAMAKYLAIDLAHELKAEADRISRSEEGKKRLKRPRLDEDTSNSKGEKDAADMVLHLQRELDEKTDKMNDLITKERQSNEELQGARRELIKREKEALDKISELERKISKMTNEINALISKEHSSNEELQGVRDELMKREKEALDKASELERKINVMNALITKEHSSNDELQRVAREATKREKEALDKVQELEKKINEMSFKINDFVAKVRSSDDELQRVCRELSKEKSQKNLLKEKEESDCEYWSLLAREQKSHAELQEARKELLKILNDSQRGNSRGIGIKQMGEIDVEVFKRVFSKKFQASEAEIGAVALCSAWKKKLKNPNWDPFQMVEDDNGKIKREVKVEDELLRGLKQHWGNEAYGEVVRALEELCEYNPRGRYAVPELWNFDENRKAKLDEIIRHFFTNTRNGVTNLSQK